MENSKVLTITPEGFTFDRNAYRNTKVLGLKCCIGGSSKITRKQPTTWASLVREVINTFQYEIEREVEDNEQAFEDRFNTALKDVINECGGKTNASFIDNLFTEPSHLKSSLYRNNQNSSLEIYRNSRGQSRCITAVYSGEVVWVINALVRALLEYDLCVEITYISREDLKKTLEELDEEERQLSIEDIPSNNEDSLEQDEDITDIQGNANLYISLLKVKLDDMYRQCGIPDKDYEQMKSWMDKIAITIIEAKSFTELVSRFSTDLSKALDN